MSYAALEAMLSINGISSTTGERVLYEILRLLAFQSACDVLRKDRSEYARWVRIFRQLQDPSTFAREITREYSRCFLDKESYLVLGQWFLAFFRKGNVRQNYPTELRERLLEHQNGYCAICGEPITSKAELDHIIPWIYVGDELADNLQLLCHRCNRQKKTSPLYQLRKLLQCGKEWYREPNIM